METRPSHSAATLRTQSQSQGAAMDQVNVQLTPLAQACWGMESGSAGLTASLGPVKWGWQRARQQPPRALIVCSPAAHQQMWGA